MRSCIIGMKQTGSLKLIHHPRPAGAPAVALAGLLLLLLAVTAAYGAPTEPSSSWVYAYFDEWRLTADCCPVFAMTAPYDRVDLAQWLMEDCAARVRETGRNLWLLHMLRREFEPERPLTEADLRLRRKGEWKLDRSVWMFDSAVSSRFKTDEKPRPEVLARFLLYTGQGLNFWTSLRTTANAPGDHKVETRPWKDRWRSSFDYGGVGYRRGNVSLFLGRDEVSWGASRDRGLLFSGTAPAMDMVKLAYRSKHVLFTSFHSQLRRGPTDPWAASVRRYVSAHRLEFLVRRLDFSIAEAAIYGGDGRDFELGYLNPLAPFYAEQWNLGDNDNILLGGDFSYLFPGYAEVRGELVVDDFQIDPGSEPNEMGFGLAADAVNPLYAGGSVVGASYFRIANRTYGHAVPWNRFTQEGRMMGYPDGPDGDRFEIWSSVASDRLSCGVCDQFSLRIAYSLRRQGQGRVTDSQVEPGRRTKFPSGTVETTQAVAAELSWRPSYPLLVKGTVGWSRTENAGNTWGQTHDGFEFTLNLTYNLRFAQALQGESPDE